MSTSLLKPDAIDKSLDRATANAVVVSRKGGGIVFVNMGETMEFAKLMSLSQQAVPPHCRNAPGVCLAITLQAVEWGMSPYAVANKSYVVNDRVCYESQLIHAVIEQRAPITSRLRCKYTGEGDTRRCIVWATPKGEPSPLEYTSPPIKRLIPPKNDRGQLKGSPLWLTKPDLQLFYNASRDWARMYFPDVIMGVYATDELEDTIINSPHVAPVKSLDDLTDRMTGTQEREPQAEESTDKEPDTTPTPEPEASPESPDSTEAMPPVIAEFRGLLEMAQTPADATAAYESAIVPAGLCGAPLRVAKGMLDDKIAELKSAKQTQQELVK